MEWGRFTRKCARCRSGRPARSTSRLLLFLALFLSVFPFFQAHANPAPSVAFWYAAQPPLPELVQFDWVVLEPAHATPPDLIFLSEQGATPFAYLSVGELDRYQSELEPELAEGASTAVRNDAWDSQVMDLASPVWRDYLLRQAAGLQQAGYQGLFLDTLDSFTLLPAEVQPIQRKALASLLRELHERHPQLKLFFNRGFEVLPELGGVADAVAVESIHAGWDPSTGEFRSVPDSDRLWLEGQLAPLRESGVPIVAIDYLPPQRREDARALARQLSAEGYVPYVTTPELDYLGVGSIEVQPRRIALLFDPREGEKTRNAGHRTLGGLLEHLGYRVDYLAVDTELPETPMAGLYAGVVTWMTSGPPADPQGFNAWLMRRFDEGVPVVFMGGLPLENAALLRRIGLRRSDSERIRPGGRIIEHDPALLGEFEAPLTARTRGLLPLSLRDASARAALTVADGDGLRYNPVVVGDWGGIALAPYVQEEGSEGARWILDPFAFLTQALRLPPLPAPDVTTENGRRIATVHIDGDGFPSRAEVPGTPYAGQHVLDAFIRPYPLLTSVSVIEGEIGPRGAYPFLSPELEPIARRIFAHEKVEVATHTYSHPFFWQPEAVSQREGFEAAYGLNMSLPGYDKLDFKREIVGSRDYINARLTTPDKPVKMVFWSGDALPDAETIALAYEAGLLNVNGGATRLTHAEPSLTGLYPLLRPTAGGLQIYAPIINENVYTNLWQGPFYGFRGVIDTFELTDSPRRLRGLHLYYHFYSGTKQASIRVMRDIYRHMLDQQPLSLFMSDYLLRVQGLYQASLAKRSDGSWQVRSLSGLRTLRLDPALGWPDLQASSGIAGVREVPQGRYVHLSGQEAVLHLRPDRDPGPALEEANIPLTHWEYLGSKEVRFGFAGEFALQFSVRSATPCRVELGSQRYSGQRNGSLWYFDLPMKEVRDARLLCQ